MYIETYDIYVLLPTHYNSRSRFEESCLLSLPQYVIKNRCGILLLPLVPLCYMQYMLTAWTHTIIITATTGALLHLLHHNTEYKKILYSEYI